MKAAGNRWWLWKQEHPRVQVVAIFALIVLIVVLIVVGDYAVNMGMTNRPAKGGH